jgi:hypothetical protein
MANTLYFQPKGIKPHYCEVGMISETDPEYIYYLDEPCKILISEVKIIDKENVIFDKKSRLIRVRPIGHQHPHRTLNPNT